MDDAARLAHIKSVLFAVFDLPDEQLEALDRMATVAWEREDDNPNCPGSDPETA